MEFLYIYLIHVFYTNKKTTSAYKEKQKDTHKKANSTH